MIRTSYLVVLIVTLLFSGGYIYSLAALVCPVPIEYRLGTIDPSFSITDAEARDVIAEAVMLWETAASRPLFVYDETADFTINFVFDERQEATDLQQSLRDRLDQTELVTRQIERQQTDLVEEHEALQVEYESAAATYEANLARYNKRVAAYNESGGAPPAVFRELEAEANALEAERVAVNELGEELNTVGEQINSLSAQGSAIVETYNRGVVEYNDRFGEAREFTQGTYQTDRIDIFSFADTAELRLVLAHELGHALTLDHVDNDESIMHYLLGAQPRNLTLTAEDKAEFHRVCTDYRWWDILKDGWHMFSHL